MKFNHYIAVLAAGCAAACTSGAETSIGHAENKTISQVNIAVSLETSPSSSDSAAMAILWPGDGGYIIGAVEDGIEVYDKAGATLSKTDRGEVEALGLLTDFGAEKRNLLLGLDTSTSSVQAYIFSGNTLTPLGAKAITSALLLEGMCSFTSSLDGESYAFLLGSNGQIQQWHLYEGKDGTLKSTLARSLQLGTEPKFCVADAKSNKLYVTEEAVGVWQFDADVEGETIPELVDVKKFGHFTGEVGGVAIHHTASGQSVLFASDVETSTVHLYDVADDNRFMGRMQLKGSGALDDVDNAGALFASDGADGKLVLADEDNGEDATNFKLVIISDIASAFNFDTKLKAPEAKDASAKLALVRPSVETTPVANGGDAADDPAIWVHPTAPEKSLIIGTNKQGGLYLYNLDGSVRQYVADGKMNNVDIRYDVAVGDHKVTLVAASNRTNESIALYQMDETAGELINIADGVQPTGMADPYGLCLYKSPKNDQTYVFINEKDGLVRQWLLDEGASGRVKATAVREFIVGSTAEGCVADDDTGILYVAEEDVALWKYGAEPDAGDAREKITDPQMNPALKDDLEGVSIYYGKGETGYIVLSSQGNNSYALFDRKAPHAYLGSFKVIADGDAGIDGSSETDGLDIISTPLGPNFPYGVFVAQDGRNITPEERQNFKLVPWERIAAPLNLEKFTERSPRR